MAQPSAAAGVQPPGKRAAGSSRSRTATPLSFLLLSLAFHVLYTVSIFDIYFTSPVVHPARRYGVEDTYAPAAGGQVEELRGKARHTAKRLVLIVGDGLRADTLFSLQPPSLRPTWERSDALSSIKPTPAEVRSYGAPTQPFYAAPHLRRIALERGAWGVSHTRVPTESRPGHVALIAGMYEDVSAVTKGWAQNPLPFDSLFNASSATFSFGSPDILPMFARGAVPGRVHTASYDESFEDFTKDATQLDLWVLEHLTALLARAKTDAELDAKLRAQGVVFFLHLLGPDTTGHTYRPFSKEYVGNAVVVDAIVAAVEVLLAEFYGEDEQTAYVFSADHGMSRKGNHGDGEKDNTRTPLVAWGRGVRGPRKLEDEEQREWRRKQWEEDEYYQGWGALDELWREDVEQADITPLMATLLGLPMPANSEGRLPLSYLSFPPSEAARAALANALGVLETYRVKHLQRAARMLRYVPFPSLPPEAGGDGAEAEPGSAAVTEIKALIARGAHEEAINASQALLHVALRGASYLQTYDWLLLCVLVSTGYLGSMAYSLAFILRTYVVPASSLPPARSFASSRGRWATLPLLLALYAKLALERAPATYFAYALFPAIFWGRAIDDAPLFLTAWKLGLRRFSGTSSPSRALALALLTRAALALAALELMALGYLHRLAWTIGFLLLAFFWPAFGITQEARIRHEGVLFLWIVVCGACAVFTVGGVEKEESVPLLVLSGAVFLVAGGVILRYPGAILASGGSGASKDPYLARTLTVLKTQLVVLVISTSVTALSSHSLQRKQGLPLPNQIIAWLALGFSTLFPFLLGFQRRLPRQAPQSPAQRLTLVVFAFAPVFVLLSIRDETLFFAAYVGALLCWARVEGCLQEERERERRLGAHKEAKEDASENEEKEKEKEGRALGLEDVRIAVTFIFFLHVGFFGTGNVASISSFYLSPVYRLVPIFSPFLMAALLLLKILVPFVLLSATFHVLCLTPPSSLLATEDRAHLVLANGRLLEPCAMVGARAPGGLGLQDAYALVLAACAFTDVLALTFLYAVRTDGSWLEIGRTITHFAMANLLQVFILGLAGLASVVVGGGGKTEAREDKEE